jgi:hypothetical protein
MAWTESSHETDYLCSLKCQYHPLQEKSKYEFIKKMFEFILPYLSVRTWIDEDCGGTDDVCAGTVFDWFAKIQVPVSNGTYLRR